MFISGPEYLCLLQISHDSFDRPRPNFEYLETVSVTHTTGFLLAFV